MLISDADRDQISAVLSEHMAQGRLTADELDQRVGRLLACRTRAEAAAVMVGLPALDVAERPHHFHLGHEHDDSAVALPSWLSPDGMLDSVSEGSNPTETVPPTAAPPSRSRAEDRAIDRARIKRHQDEDAIGHVFQARRRALTAELERATTSHDHDQVQRLSETLREVKETAAAARRAAAAGDRAEVQRQLQRLRSTG